MLVASTSVAEETAFGSSSGVAASTSGTPLDRKGERLRDAGRVPPRRDSSPPGTQDGAADPLVESSLVTRCCGTANQRTLWVLAALTLSFASAQTVAALAANSLTLLGDSATMLLDGVTYVVNLYAASRRGSGPEAARRAELMEVRAAAFSVAALLLMTALLAVDALGRVCCSAAGHEEAVDGRIVLGFALANLATDVVMCSRFLYASRVSELKSQLNLASAYAHLVGDTLRTLASVVAGSVEMTAQTVHDTLSVDGALTLFVCCVIFVGTLVLARETWTRWKRLVAVERGATGAQENAAGGAYGSVRPNEEVACV